MEKFDFTIIQFTFKIVYRDDAIKKRKVLDFEFIETHGKPIFEPQEFRDKWLGGMRGIRTIIQDMVEIASEKGWTYKDHCIAELEGHLLITIAFVK